MANFLQQNWIWILFIAAMLAMHLGGHRHGGHSGRGGRSHGGCGDATRPDRAHVPHRPDPTRDAVNPDDRPAGLGTDSRAIPHTRRHH